MSDRPPFGASGLAWWPLGLVLLAADQWTKWLIQARFALHESVTVLPVLDILYARNEGAAFSFLANAGGWQRWAFTGFALVVSALLLVSLRRMVLAGQRLQCAGLMLIASGALGNAIDRIRHGYVVDFIGVHWGDAWFPAFNVADSCITVGAGLLLLDALREWRSSRRDAGRA